METTQIIAKVANECLRPPVPPDCPWKEVMVKCWAEVPQERLEFSDIVRELGVILKEILRKSVTVIREQEGEDDSC